MSIPYDQAIEQAGKEFTAGLGWNNKRYRFEGKDEVIIVSDGSASTMYTGGSMRFTEPYDNAVVVRVSLVSTFWDNVAIWAGVREPEPDWSPYFHYRKLKK